MSRLRIQPQHAELFACLRIELAQREARPSPPTSWRFYASLIVLHHSVTHGLPTPPVVYLHTKQPASNNKETGDLVGGGEAKEILRAASPGSAGTDRVRNTQTDPDRHRRTQTGALIGNRPKHSVVPLVVPREAFVFARTATSVGVTPPPFSGRIPEDETHATQSGFRRA